MGTVNDISGWFNLAVTQIEKITTEEIWRSRMEVKFYFKPGEKQKIIKKIWNKVPDDDRLKILIQREIYLMYPNLKVMDKPPEGPE